MSSAAVKKLFSAIVAYGETGYNRVINEKWPSVSLISEGDVVEVTVTNCLTCLTSTSGSNNRLVVSKVIPVTVRVLNEDYEFLDAENCHLNSLLGFHLGKLKDEFGRNIVHTVGDINIQGGGHRTSTLAEFVLEHLCTSSDSDARDTARIDVLRIFSFVCVFRGKISVVANEHLLDATLGSSTVLAKSPEVKS
jgi:hypothetical protein